MILEKLLAFFLVRTFSWAELVCICVVASVSQVIAEKYGLTYGIATLVVGSVVCVYLLAYPTGFIVVMFNAKRRMENDR